MASGGFEHESWRVLRERGHDPERMTPDALARRFPAWRGEVYLDGYFNRRAGWAESGLVVERVLALCEAAGVRVSSAALRPLAPKPTTMTVFSFTSGPGFDLGGMASTHLDGGERHEREQE